MSGEKKEVTAYVVLKGALETSAELKDRNEVKKRLDRLAQALGKLGLTEHRRSAVGSITIRCPQSIFEAVFRTRLEYVPQKRSGQGFTTAYFRAMSPIMIPDSLGTDVEHVVLPSPIFR